MSATMMDLLAEHTADRGSFSVYCQPHRDEYQTIREYLIPAGCDEATIAACEATGQVWRLFWYRDSPIAHYWVVASCWADFEREVLALIEEVTG
jgi:hypothetical protein